MAETKLIDQVHLLIQSGDGGNGCDAVLKRPDKKVIRHGGDGGKGGSVIFRADMNAAPIADLKFKQHLIAGSGGHGGSHNKRGKNGKDLEILVPVGTRLMDRQRGLLIRELMKPGEEVIVIEGGKGGMGNTGGREATLGEKGKSLDIELNVRVLADVFLVGLPSSGKSLLLNELTRAHIKSEEYPFSTRTPQLGVCAASDYERITLCELPSLYATSHEGRGLGNDFLKHLEKAGWVFYVLDPLCQFAPSLQEGFNILRAQLEHYNKSFLDIPFGIIITKRDLPGIQQQMKAEGWKPQVPVFFISSLTREGLDELKDFMKDKFCGNKN